MRDFSRERKDKKADRRKLTARIRRLTRYMIWHYVLLGFSATNASLALFAVLNTDAPWRGPMLLLIVASLMLAAYLLFSGVEK